MTDSTRDCAGKKRKLPHGDSASAENRTMGQTAINGNENGDADACIVEHISYVEFYSGVGGWTMALEEALHNLGPLLSSIRTKKSKAAINLHTETTGGSTSSDSSLRKKPLHRYELKRLAALDHSDLCVRVFSHNFVQPKTTIPETDKAKQKRKPKNLVQQKSYSIERLPLHQLEEWSADVWVMSPPCQPHTRQHNDKNHQDQQHKKDLEDPRSKSFLKICEWLEGATLDGSSGCSSDKAQSDRLSDMSLPSLIFLENVVGFESSNSFRKWRSALNSRGYRVGHFHLTPTQVQLPNDRPRYYSVAFRGAAGIGFNKSLNSLSALPASPDHFTPPPANHLLLYLQTEAKDIDSAPKIRKAIPELHVAPEDSKKDNEKISPISSFLDRNNADANAKEETFAMLRVPEKVLKNQSAWCFDIVGPSDRRSSCFTHSYGRFIRGTGSILYDNEEIQQNSADAADDDGTSKSNNNNSTNNGAIQLLPPDQREFQADWMKQLDPVKLRYFSGNELSRLFGFSKSFSFPSDTSLKQQWKLMGNSLNVRVASKLIELGFLLRYYYCLDEFKATKTTALT